MSAKKFRKKPVEIEAMRYTNGSGMEVYRWIEASTLGSFDVNQLWMDPESFSWPESGVSIDARDGRMVIATLEGGLWTSPGDYVIRGVKGEFYPIKESIFRETYEAVEGNS